MKSQTHISELSRGASRSGIELKLTTLALWVEDGIPWVSDDSGQPQRDGEGELKLDWFPTSLATFAAWTGVQNCRFVQRSLPDLKTCSRETLYKDYNSDLHVRVVSVIKALAQRAGLQKEQSNKTTHLRILKADTAYLRALTEMQASQIVQMRQRLSDIEIELRKEQRARRDNNALLTAQLAQRDSRISELTATVAAIAPLQLKQSSK